MDVRFLNASAKILVNPDVQKKMQILIDMCHTEVGWLCLVKREAKLVFRVTELYIIEQGVHGATTELDPDAVARLYRKLWEDNVITMENQHEVGLYLWGHSHVNMSTGPSGQDDSQFRTLYSAQPPFYIRVIANKKGEINTDVFIKDTTLGDLILSKVAWVVDDVEDTSIRAIVKKELDDKVKPLSTYRGPGHYRVDPLPTPAYNPNRPAGYGAGEYQRYFDESGRLYPEYEDIFDTDKPVATKSKEVAANVSYDAMGNKIISTVGLRGVGEVSRKRRKY